MAGASASQSGFFPWARTSSAQPARLPGTPAESGPRARSSRTLKRSTGKCCGTRGTKSSTLTRRSAATQQVASPAPASPDMYGSTTLSAAAVATAASKALPPDESSRAPACAASGCAAATTPLVDEMVGRRPCMMFPRDAPSQHEPRALSPSPGGGGSASTEGASRGGVKLEAKDSPTPTFACARVDPPPPGEGRSAGDAGGYAILS